MANMEVRLKVSKASYEEKISMLKDYLNELDRTVAAYQRKEIELDTFMDGSDDNYDKVKNSVETNVKAVQKAREMCDSSIKMLEETLRDMDDFGQNISKTIETAADAAVSGLKAGFTVMNTLG